MTDFVSSPAAQIHFERSARRAGTQFERRGGDGRRLLYRFEVDVPRFDHERVALVEFVAGSAEARVFIDGPPCGRHRYADGSVCMWLRSDPAHLRWIRSDGLQSLVGYITEHAYCEACCRNGEQWPKLEAPGQHPRPKNCPSCSR